MDIVYLLKNSPTNEELTYSLRSLVNLPHDKVFLVGGCPTNIDKTKITHIPTLQGNNKFHNTTKSIQIVSHNESLSENFILMNDDFFILKPIRDLEKELNLCRGTIEEVEKDYLAKNNGQVNEYLTGMQQTRVYLQDIGFKYPLSYELHIPMVLNKKRVLDMFSMPYLDSINILHWRSVYGNRFLKDSQIIQDVKVLKNYFYPLGSDKFLSSEDNSWPRVKTYIAQIFKDKSIYES